jgi:hypothetical protein
MNLAYFHKTFSEHLSRKSKDVAKIIALDSNNEKWFQGEMVLAFTEKDSKWRVFSSQCYNEFDNKSVKEWNDYISDGGIITIEANVYKSVKVERDKASGARKVDVLFEDERAVIFTEMKILWLYKFNKNPKKYLTQKGVLDDTWRLINNLYDEYRIHSVRPYLYLSLICINDVEEKYSIKRVKKELKEELNDYLGKPFITDQRMEDGKISSYDADYIIDNNSLCSEVYDKKYTYEIHLVTVEIPPRNRGKEGT